MGTSTSSSGGKAGSPFDPEWLTSSGAAGAAAGGNGASDGGGDASGADGQQDGGSEGAVDGDFAPNRRFADARTKMSAYLAGGGRPSLRAAAKSMVTRGMGGSSRAASTMRGTSRGAGALGQFLASARDGSDPRVADWVNHARQSNMAADDLIVELVKEVMPSTGSIDDESLRNAAAEALGQLYELNPDIDIFNLTDAQIHDVMAITIANDVCNRMDQQLGQAYEKLKYEPQQIQLYRQDVKEYVQSEVRVVMERHGSAGLDPKSLAHEVLKSSLEVFAS
ncbi:Qat anti-phage system associated protein QatB [Pseudaquabacterium rugosum]|uniref:Qat anti-phage system associated protein QatB n=1 Tax=Pseudaquabacterium rugosum TaxID=2984194 RepID=A0ABU9B3U4_9BURK